ncbi:glucoamylase family protein [Fontivita pretiosa]|uniref:glucoamylase family protein n=1 Tax=Fontivita pretiosa TaxID=2989684 RepID=UPI003D1876FC
MQTSKPHKANRERRCEIELLERRRLLAGAAGAGAGMSPVQSELLAASPAIHLQARASRLRWPVSVSRADQPQQLGAGFFADSRDIGSPAISGSTVYASGVYTITAGGSDIGGTSDQFHFASNPSSGDGSIVARVTSLTNTSASAKAGIMFRNGLSADAAMLGIFLTPGNGIMLVVRSADGAAAGQTIAPGFAAPRWLRLTRVGSQITAYHSANGVTWTQLGSPQTIALGASARVGLAATSRNVSAATTATFANLSLQLPPGWSGADVGSASPGGSSMFDPASSSFVVSGGGAAGIGGISDQFHFLSRSITGDTSLIARIGAISNTDPLAQAGLMFRDDSGAGARFAAVSLTAQNSLVFQWRTTSGTAASSASLTNITGPVWLKLTQQANSYSAFYSSDGSQWTQIGVTQSVAMTSATTLGGLVVSSHSSSSPATGSFSSVSVVQEGFSLADIGSPALSGSATYDAASNTSTLLSAGAGIGGSFDQFDFLGRTLSGSGMVVAYVNSLADTIATARAGVMMRADATAGSAFVGLFVSAQGGLTLQWRPSAGAATVQQNIASVSAPISLRLTRSGNNFAAAYSTDGVNFSIIGLSMTMPATVLAGVALASQNPNAYASASFTGVAVGRNLPPGAGIYSAADELFLHDLSQRSVRFFYDETNPATGLVPDGSNANGGSPTSASSIAAVGFGLTALTIGDKRGWLTHAEAYQRAWNTINFLYTNGAHVNGFFYHFLDPLTGQRAWNSELSSIDTALLMAGVLNVAAYWKGTPLETVANNLFNRVNWPWMLMPNGNFFGHWTPEGGFGGGYVDFSEAVLLYLLGLGSSTHPTARSTWTSWPRAPVINYSGYTFVTATTRALFTVQYPMGWFDLRGLADSTGLNYYANAQTATLAQRQMFINLSSTWPQYGANNWGATAADGPGGYTVWGGPPPTSNIDGTVVPTAPGGSLAFTPRQSIDALKHMQQTYGGTVWRKYGFVDAFNPHTGWTSAIVLGLDVGMMLLAAENSRSNFAWDTFKQHAVARQAVASAFPSVTPTLLGAASRKTGSMGTVDLPLSLNDEALAVESRAGGPTQLVLSFGASIVKGSNFNVSLTTPTGGANGIVLNSTVSGSSLIIDVSGVADAQTLVVNITDVRHFSDTAAGNYTLRLGVLAGDATGDGRVDTADLNIVSANWQATGATCAQGDFTSDGMVNSRDLLVLSGNWNESLPAAPALLAPPPEPPYTAATLFSSRTVARATDDDNWNLIELPGPHAIV